MTEAGKEEALVSVIIPVYKIEDYLDACVQSVLRQTYRNLEIILVDDGSPDRCAQMCDSYAEKDRRVRVIHKENGGLADARNAGIREARGEYFLLIDGDDMIADHLAESTVRLAESLKADIVIFDYETVEKDGGKGDRLTMNLPAEKVISLKNAPSLLTVSCSAVNKLYRREFWEQCGVTFPVGRNYEDLGTIPRLWACAERVVYKKEALYYYVMRDGSIMHSTDFQRNYRDRTFVMDSVLSFYKKKGLYEKYKKELEYMVFENTYFVPSKEIVLNDRRSKYLGKFRGYAYSRFPELRHNPYIRRLSRKDKILWLLLQCRMYGVMIFLSKVRRMRDHMSLVIGRIIHR